MEFYCIGISHLSASLDLREKLSCTRQQIDAALRHYVKHADHYLGRASEIAILSTCNRFEIYATLRGVDHPYSGNTDAIYRGLEAFVTDCFEITIPSSRFERYDILEAVEHLFRVSAGLESQVIGETQILGQVSEALNEALHSGSARHTLGSLFRAAIYAARRAQSETSIGKQPTSISSVATSIAEQISGNLSDREILVVGAGEMSTLAVKSFRQRGARKITAINRTMAHAGHLAARYGCTVRPWSELTEALRNADIVVSSTRSQQPVMTFELVQSAMQRRPAQPLLMLDIALPRDIDPAVQSLPGVQLYDLDTIKDQVDHTYQHRMQEAKQVEAILKEEIQAFRHWMTVIPTVGKLHKKAEKIRQQEMERMIKHLPELDTALHQQIEQLTRSLVKKLLHEPTRKMHTLARQGQHELYAGALYHLFRLDEEDDAMDGEPQ